MKDSDNLIAINILDRTYKIKCPNEQAYELQQAAQYVNEQMKKLRFNSNITNTENLAVVTALNVTHELLQLKNQKNQYIDNMNVKIQHLQERIQEFLATEEEILV